MKPNLAVYLGSSGHARPIFKEACRALARELAPLCNFVYGGMNAGLMGLLATQALRSGAHVTGVIPRRLQDSERAMKGLSETIWVGTLSERKFDMFCRADAFVIMPGGYGTLDEALEVLYWRALGHHSKPLYLVNIDGYWDDIIPVLSGFFANDPKAMQVVDSIDQLKTACAADFADFDPNTHPHYSKDPLPHFEDLVTNEALDYIVAAKPDLENLTKVLTALGLKQLGKHRKPIGFLNDSNQFAPIIAWINRAAAEHFITAKCLDLFSISNSYEGLVKVMDNSPYQAIDLHTEKWGDQ